MFSVAALVVTVCAAGQVHYLFGGRPGQVGTWSDLAALAGAATTYFAVNTLLVATAIALSTRSPISQVWTRNFLWSAPGFFVAAGTATAVVLLLQSSSHWLIALAVVPMYLTYRSYAAYVGRIREEQQRVQRMADLHLATIEALAVAIDAKDQTNHMHIRRVQLYAASLAKSLGLPDADIQGIRTAALLHDIGKLAVPEHILSKPGPLTPEEFQKIRAHPKTGADILAGVPFPYPVAPLILSHHERWDGKGYPQGLRGEEIPFGARILTVVDYFDALMAERPYHKAMPFEDAVALLRQDAGKALDPAIVDGFIDLLPELQAEAATLQTPHPALDLSAIHRAAPRATVFEDIALAHREIYALYEISQAMGKSLGVSDTMALITDKLSILVPFSTAALFLYDEQHDSLKCRYATGVDELLLQQLTVRNGDGLTGWVGRNRRALVNAQPSADLEAAGLPAGASELQSALICPLVLNERVIGTLGVYHVEPVFYREDHRRLLDRVAEQAAAAVRNSVLFEQTQQQSRTDSLTGLANNRSLIDRLDREMARAERLKSEVAMLLIDLDDFKDINDTYGHHVGDRALCEIADVLRTAIRPYDTCARYAGDEFIVLLSGCGMEDAEQKRQELQQLVGELVFEPVAGRRVQLAISAGAAVFPSDGHSYEALLSTADSRMYQDKSRRKRRSLVVRSKTPAPPVHGAASPDADDRGAGTAH
jgi:diguanylate cyclase (GGDEF)-like protein/putative nucleotidyltransferase with HDIG domain